MFTCSCGRKATWFINQQSVSIVDGKIMVMGTASHNGYAFCGFHAVKALRVLIGAKQSIDSVAPELRVKGSDAKQLFSIRRV